MTKSVVVILKNVSKKYKLHHEKPTLVENILGRGVSEEFLALNKINTEVLKGEKLGIIGPNGSGKTTLLEVISGITTPTSGSVETYGRLTSLIELDAGFQPDLTGEENIFLNGLLLGMSKIELHKGFKDIVKFADIGNFIDAPLYTYSEGMKLRLGFSVAVHTNPDILVLDENLSIGDKNFQKKSGDKIQEFFKLGKTIIIVSHNMRFLKENCERVIWLDHGKIVKDGNSKKVIAQYLNGNAE